MADAPLFYSTVVPLDRARHRELKLALPERSFGFAARSHMIPALISEFGLAARHIPIVFVAGALRPTPVFLVGLRTGQNALVGPDGAWRADYVPAYLRRYPFIVGEVEGAEPLVCVDEAAQRLSRQTGQPLFDAEGRETPLLGQMIRLTHDYKLAAQGTDVAGATLQDLDLLRAITIELKAGSQPAGTLQGIFAIDEAKLAGLAEEQIVRLHREGLLGALYAHLISLQSIDRLDPARPGPSGA